MTTMILEASMGELIPDFAEARQIFGGDTVAALRWAVQLGDSSISIRDKLIALAWIEGMSTRQIAEAAKISHARVGQVLHEVIPGPLTAERREELRKEWVVSG